MSNFKKKRILLGKTNLDLLNKVEVACLFWDAAYAEAMKAALEVLSSYENMDKVKQHVKETLEKE